MSRVHKFFGEFREFAVKGNAIELAVGIVIGSSFNNIVNSLVNDVIMPPFSLLMGKVDLANRFVNLSDTPVKTLAEAKARGLPTLNYGLFTQQLINFLIVAFTLFVIVKAINRLRREQERLEKKKAAALAA